jgi:phage terminase Nu1 subunit (DNA packaging protein)
MLDKMRVHDRITNLAATFKAYIELLQKDKTKTTKGDRRRLQEFEVELNSILEPHERSDVTVDVNTVARFFNVTIRTVQNWTKLNGCPKLRHGLYDLKAVFEWYKISPFSQHGDDNEKTMELKEELLYWQKENARLKAQQTSSELVPRSAVIPSWAARFAEVKSYLLGQQPDRIPSMLDLDEATYEQLRSAIIKENRRALEAFARDGEFTPKEACNVR